MSLIRCLPLLLVLTLLLNACALGPGGAPGPAAQAPDFRVGDRWVYQAEDGYRVRIQWTETHEIAAIDASGLTVRVTLKGDSVDLERIERWTAPGIVAEGAVYEAETVRFVPALIRYNYPLTPGETWSQRIRNADAPPGPFGPINRHVRVGGYETIATPAGAFDALRLRVIMSLDDETFWRWPTQVDNLVWYAPAVGAMVQEQKRSSFRDKGGNDPASYHPGQNALLRLASYRKGP